MGVIRADNAPSSPSVAEKNNAPKSPPVIKTNNVPKSPSMTKKNYVPSIAKKKSAEQKQNEPTMNKKPSVSPKGGKQRVEVVEDSEKEKTLRLYHNLDKYIKGSAEKGPRGYKIAEFQKMFGSDLKNVGVDIGWKLTKLGKKDVSKAFYQMTRTNIGVEFRNSQNKGYEVTFSAPDP